MESASIRETLANIEDPLALLEGLFEAAPVAFQIYAADGHCVLVNRAFRELFGSVPPPEYNVLEDEIASERGVLELVHRGFRGETIHIPPTWYDPRELKKFDADGRRVAIETSVFPIFDRNREVSHVAFVFKDLTEILDREAKIERLIDSNIIGVLFWTKSGKITEANDAFLRMVGYGRDALERGEVSWRAMTPPEHASADRRALEELVHKGSSTPYEKELFRSDGTRVPVLVGGATFEGTSDKGVAFAMDLSDRKRAEEAFRRSEHRFRAMVENSSDAIKLLSREGLVIYASPSTAAVVGYAPHEYVGTNIFAAIHPDDLADARVVFKSCLGRPGVPVRSQHRVRHKDGSYRWVEVLRVNRLSDPELYAIVTNYRDVTDRKRLEDQLLQSQKMEAVGRLAGGIAHDFNNMLSAIVGFSHMIIGDLREGDPILGDMHEIAAAAERAAQLTRQLLAFSRKQVMQPRVLDLGAHVREMDKMLRRLIGENIELVVETASGLDLVKVDPGQIEQVILNLVINARDAMPNGGKLVIETANAILDQSHANDHVGVAPGSYVMLAVRDTGQGMDRHVRERIFEPFFTTKEGGRGTGLGLSTVLGIVQQSGGHIWVYSEPGQGTTFKVYLPRCQERLPSVPIRSSRAPSLRGHETILLVEDEEVVLTFASRALRRQGYSVLEARNGDEALLIAERHPKVVDLLLTDVVMPRMSGPELANRLKARRPELIVLYMSGYTEDANVHDGVLDSDVELLEKPLRPELLLSRVRELLER